MASVSGGDKLAAFLKKIRELNGDVDVGFFEGDKYPQRSYTINGKQVSAGEAVEVAYIAKLMEYGVTQNITDKQRKFLHAIGFHLRNDTKSLHIPARPFFKKTLEDNRKHYIELFQKALIQFDYDMVKSLESVGAVMSDDVKKAIADVTEPKNHGFTIQQKGFDKPLKGKGSSILQKSVKHKVSHK